MRVFVPPFIVDGARRGLFSGTVPGAVVMIDFPGFTALTEEYMARGTRGAEELSLVLNGMLGTAVEGIVAAGGFIGGFAGDSVTGVLPGRGAAEASRTAAKISHALASSKGSGPGSLVKIGIASGTVSWDVIPGRGRLFHYFSGAPVAAASAEQEACAPGAIRSAGHVAVRDAAPAGKAAGSAPMPCCSGDFFVPERVGSLASQGEFRFVTSVFVAGPSEGPGPGREFVARVLDLAERYDGFLSGVDTKPAGANLLVLFGAPVTHEDDAARADGFLADLLGQHSGSARAGVECGEVFAGLLGSGSHTAYTAIGAPVNLAARLLYLASSGCALSGPSFARRSLLRRSQGMIVSLKGIRTGVEAVSLSPGGSRETASGFSGVFAGRRAEMDALGALLPAGPGDPARQVLVTGEAGAGKSRLLHEFEAAHGEAVFHHLRCDGIQQRGFNPFARLLRQLSGHAEGMDPSEGRRLFEERLASLGRSGAAVPGSGGEFLDQAEFLRSRAPALGSLLGMEWPDSVFGRLDPKLRFDNILTSLRGLLGILAGGAPSVIVIEDAHWLDRDSRKALELAAAALSAEPILWMVLARPPAGSDHPFEPLPGSKASVIDLPGLEPGAASSLVSSELRGSPSEALSGYIHAHTGGNPLFVEQYCRFLSERGLVEEASGGLVLCSVVEGLPAGLNPVLVARIDRLPAIVRQAVQAASVLGREFEADVLASMLGEDDAGAVLLRGVEEQIWQPAGGRLHMFRHALLRDAAYSMQLGARLAELHALAAGAIRALRGGDPAFLDDLAYHYERAGMIPEAVEYLGLAAAQAAHSYLNSQAVDLYSRLASLLPDGQGKARAILAMADVEWASGMWDEALAHCRGAIDMCRLLGLHALEANARQRAGRILLDTGDEDAGMETLREAEACLDREEDFSTRSRIIMVRTSFLLQSNTREGMEDALETGLRYAIQSGDEEQCLRVRGNMGNYCLEVGNFAAALSHYEDVRNGAERLGITQLKALSLGNMALASKYLGDEARAVALFREQLALANEMGNRLLEVLALGNLGSSLSRGWEWTGAADHFRRAVRMAADLGAAQHEGIARSNLCDHCLRTGETAEALHNSTEAVRLCREKGLEYYIGSFLLVHARALLCSGRPREAMEAVEEAVGHPMMDDYRKPAAIITAAALARTGCRGESMAILSSEARSDDLETAAEASWLLWRLTSLDADRSAAVESNRRWLVEGRYPWATASRLRSMGEDVSSLPPVPDHESDMLEGC